METSAPANKSSKGDRTRQRIIQKAAQVFNRHGFAGASIADLMEATGLEKGGIYRHFESKQELAEAAFDYAWVAVSAPRERGLAEQSSSLDKLLLFVRNFVGEPPRTITGGCPRCERRLAPLFQAGACESPIWSASASRTASCARSSIRTQSQS
jgi:AcrR family transcriptional regulator